MEAVGSALWHQSQEATDCRWLRLMAVILAGKLQFASHLKKLVDMFSKYPDGYDGERSTSSNPCGGNLSGQFTASRTHLAESLLAGIMGWHRLFAGYTNDILVLHMVRLLHGKPSPELRENLQDHWLQTHSSTLTDPKHDAIFGMSFFALRTLEEMLGIGIGTSVYWDDSGSRTILEVRINLKYLLTEDDPNIWQNWRRYGAGQAKLNALRF